MKGFTLIELLVAGSIFTVISFVAIGAFINVSDAQRRSAAMQNVLDSSRFAMEQMVKEIRMGKDYSLYGSGQLFFDAAGTSATPPGKVTYKKNGNALERKGASGGFAAITPNSVIVEDLIFSLRQPADSQPADSQPMITIFLKVKSLATKANTEASVNLQTTVSSRQF